MYIYTNEFVLPNTGQLKMQLITYGMMNKCNSLNSKLCNGMVSFVPINLNDKVNTQFVKQITNTGKTYLIHKPTKLMLTYFFITQDMIDVANKYPTNVRIKAHLPIGESTVGDRSSISPPIKPKTIAPNFSSSAIRPRSVAR